MGEKFDLIVANPPYLSESETTETTPEVQAHEPGSALTSAGTEGTRDLETIIKQSPQFLATGGMLALETGIAQHAALSASATQAGFTAVESLKDLTQRDRYVFAAIATS